MRRRKTVEISDIKAFANKMLARKDSDFLHGTPQEWIDGYRDGVARVLEHFLYETHNYSGFNYVEWSCENGYEKWLADGMPADNTPYLGNQHRHIYY